VLEPEATGSHSILSLSLIGVLSASLGAAVSFDGFTVVACCFLVPPPLSNEGPPPDAILAGGLATGFSLALSTTLFNLLARPPPPNKPFIHPLFVDLLVDLLLIGKKITENR
jgi:hypothetical protein